MRTLKNSGGFTLPEILAAMTVTVIALIGMASVTVMVIKGNSFSKLMTTAATLVNDKLEELKNDIFTAGDLASGDHSDTGNPFHALFTRTWSVADTLDPASAKVVMKTVTVRVTWSWEGRRRNVTIKTIIANPNYY